LRAGDSLGEGRYVLVEELGRGGFAVVWKAKDEVKKRHVAIKVLHANLAGDAIRRERFYRGARAMRRLQHPGVVRVFDPEGEDGGFCYFVMELVRNGNLHDAVVRKRVQRGVVLEHILRVGEALAEAHSQGLIHRDIKPQNILLDELFAAKLTDFDLVGSKDTTGGTRTGSMGTVIYAAPECLERPQEATARVDVFGLGMTAIFCLAGKALTLSTLRNAEPTITELDCSPAVKEVLRRAVAWEPEARYADAGAMVSGLRAAMSRELGANVVTGDAVSGAEAGGAVPSGVVSATPDAIVSPLPTVAIAPSAPMPLSPSTQSAGRLAAQVPGFWTRVATGEPARSARGASRADDTQNSPWVADRSIADLPVFGSGEFSEPAVIVPIQARPNNNKLMYALIAFAALLAVAAVVFVVLLKNNTGSGRDMSAAQVASATDRARATLEEEPGVAAGKPAEAKPADTGTEPKPSDSKPPEPSPAEPRNVKLTASIPPPEPAHAADPNKPADESAAKPQGDAKGYVVISCTPQARIWVYGKDTGLSTPIIGHTLPLMPGKHRVTFSVDGEKFTFPITVKAGETVPLHKDLGDSLGAPPASSKVTAAPEETKETGVGCDEVSCVLNNYEGVCCAKFKKGGSKPASGGTGDRPAGGKGDVPDSLDRGMISEGVSKVKARVMSCGDKSSAKGIVKVSVKVGPDGNVSGVTVKQTPDAALGDCVAGAMQKATFVKTQTGGEFRYPFTF
jgi:tRNA A-37 threonylcarbamoyl transferase component Bud32/outer membrane biosynthesis protein TonB